MTTTREKRAVVVGLAAILIAGCAGAPRLATPSGKPEAVIAAAPTAIKAAIIGDMSNSGYTVEQDTEFSLVLARPLRGDEHFAAGMILGGERATRSRLATYTFVRTPEGVRVIAGATLRAGLKSEPIDTPRITADLSEQLAAIKVKLEPR